VSANIPRAGWQAAARDTPAKARAFLFCSRVVYGIRTHASGIEITDAGVANRERQWMPRADAGSEQSRLIRRGLRPDQTYRENANF